MDVVVHRVERVAVGGRVLRLLGAARARGAADVGDHHGLAQALLQPGDEGPEDVVGVAARRPGHDQLDGAVRVGRRDIQRNKGGKDAREYFGHHASSSKEPG